MPPSPCRGEIKIYPRVLEVSLRALGFVVMRPGRSLRVRTQSTRFIASATLKYRRLLPAPRLSAALPSSRRRALNCLNFHLWKRAPTLRCNFMFSMGDLQIARFYCKTKTTRLLRGFQGIKTTGCLGETARLRLNFND